MQGVIIDVGTGERLILGDDGGRYRFASVSWQADDVSPEAGIRVGFKVKGPSAVDVYPLSAASATVTSAAAWKNLRRWVQAAIGSIVLVGILGVCAGFLRGSEHSPLSGPDPNAPEQVRLHEEITDAGFSTYYARAYTEQILSGESPSFSHAYATHIAIGSIKIDKLAYAEQIDAGHLHWYAYPYAQLIGLGKSPTYAHAFVEKIDAGHLPHYIYEYPIHLGPRDNTWSFALLSSDEEDKEYAQVYAELVDEGKSPTYASTYADARFLYVLDEGRAREIAEGADVAASFAPIDVAVVLAMYSTTEDAEADKRATSVLEMTDYLGRGNVGTDRALELLNEIAPEASIGERQKALERLVGISGDSDGALTVDQSLQVADELTGLITGHGIYAEQRVEAAHEMVRLTQLGELNADNAAELTDTIAPEWSVAERKEALGYLAWQFAQDDWDSESTKRTAEEGYTLITGGELRIERRLEAGVELVGEGLKRFGGDRFDDKSIGQATDLIKGAISGGLSTESVSKTLGLNTVESSSPSSVETEDTYRKAFNSMYDEIISIGYSREYATRRATQYAKQIVVGRSEDYSYDYAKLVVDGISQENAHTFARRITLGKRGHHPHYYVMQFIPGESARFALIAANVAHHVGTLPEKIDKDTYVRVYAEQLANGKSYGYARTFAEQIADGRSVNYAQVYAQQIGAGRLPRYAHGYALSLVTNSKDDTYAQNYAHAYAQTILPGYRSTHSSIYTTEFETSEPDRLASIYADQIAAGRSENYARAYLEQIAAGNSESYARAYVEQIATGKSSMYASVYAWLVDLLN